MNMGLNVLSLFDGISGGQLALQRAGIEVNNYFASEIDKYAIQVTQKNFPNTVQLGNIENWKGWDLPKIDLILAGSPCQGFSNAGLGLNFDDPRSKLFFVFCDILAVQHGKNPDLKYLLENVKMKKEWRDIITDRMKVEPVLINSALVSAQNRKRLYWANWEFGQPEDRGIYLKDIIEDGEVDREKSYTVDANYYKGGNPKSYFDKGRRRLVFEHQSHRRAMVKCQGAAIRKSNCVVPSYTQKLNGMVRVGDIYPSGGIAGRIYSVEGKSPALRTPTGGNHMPKIATDEYAYRKLTVLECERLQTLPEGYTEGISNTQRYKCIGNGWTIDVVAHILHGIKS
jgi:DNA-cytosine methyltransferase